MMGVAEGPETAICALIFQELKKIEKEKSKETKGIETEEKAPRPQRHVRAVCLIHRCSCEDEKKEKKDKKDKGKKDKKGGKEEAEESDEKPDKKSKKQKKEEAEKKEEEEEDRKQQHKDKKVKEKAATWSERCVQMLQLISLRLPLPLRQGLQLRWCFCNAAAL